MLRPATPLRSARAVRHLLRRGRAGGIARALGPAAMAALAAAFGAGCFDTVSLGAGAGEGGGGADGAPVKLRFPEVAPDEQELRIPDLECFAGLTTDLDGDGWTPAEGDCNDCDPDQGPSAVEMPTSEGDAPRDEDCDGEVDEAVAACDAGLALDDPAALAGARAIDLCQVASGGRWGVVQAVWVLPDGGTPPLGEAFALGHGLVDRFGPNMGVRHGHRMLALSSGTARQPGEDGYLDPRGFDKKYTSKVLDGLAGLDAACPGVVPGEPHDGIALEVIVRAPQNAGALAFDFAFYTYEFPDRVCTVHADLFAALLRPAPSAGMKNVALDEAGHPIGVNSVRFQACGCEGGPPCSAGGISHECSLGVGPLLGTGFGADVGLNGDRAATGWLTSRAAVERGGTLTIRFAIQDAEDGQLDSTVLVDHVRWESDSEQIARTLRK